MSSTNPIRVLFLCTHNTTRSIMAEAVLNHLGKGFYTGYSAGSHPNPNQAPNPFALQVLQSSGIATEGLRSKSWDEYGLADAPAMDLIITVCDSAAAEKCPVWQGHPATAHWSYPDPSFIAGADSAKIDGFRSILLGIRRRLDALVNIPEEKISKLTLQKTIKDLE